MAQVCHMLKLIHFLSLFSVSSLSWPPPLFFWPLFLLPVPQLQVQGRHIQEAFKIQACKCQNICNTFLVNILMCNGIRVYQLLGESGTYYSVHFGKSIPWVSQFPFGVIKDPRYVGSIMSLLACLS
ncbi:phosphatidyl-N-methylethanolamine N-methyltransferase-like [Actinidia eriantha]|uniref:phosphatidyl-N-methylethanolamine N-methyltransferase-like n=1 Tax=Actinidia eriantha TaxID=165200 RepID=UPI0025867DD4|nr:phosphatidyl-N-methylethanolamine N-methyltransferase-like [Actinidia eriantha]